MPLFFFHATRARRDLMSGNGNLNANSSSSSNGVVKRWRVNIADHANALPTELANISLNGTVKRDSDLWFEDGNIILLCRDVAFRMYHGLLTRHSVIFKDLFAMAQPSGSETIESCPVVHISDPPDDLRYLLRVLCGLRKCVVPSCCFECLASFIRTPSRFFLRPFPRV